MEVRRINAKDTYPIRQKLLCPDGCQIDYHFKGDEEDQTFHLGAMVDNHLVSIASFYFERNEELGKALQYQLRGMATLPEFQKQGHSSALLKTAFPIIKQNQCQLLWCNAHKEVIGFYQKVGFEKVKGPFDLFDIGAHYLMVKKLD